MESCIGLQQDLLIYPIIELYRYQHYFIIVWLELEAVLLMEDSLEHVRFIISLLFDRN